MVILNKLNITYSAVMPQGRISRARAESNEVSTEILTYSVTKSIRCDKKAVLCGENFHADVTIADNAATKLFNNFFKIPQPIGASYVEGSVKINGIAQPNLNPISGFALPDLNPGESIVIGYDLTAVAPTTTSVTHFAKIDYALNDPVRGEVKYSEDTDTVAVDVVAGQINVTKSVDKSYAVKGETLHYTITIANLGGIAKTDTVFKDPIPYGATFVAGSVKIDGVSYAIYNPEVGFALSDLQPNDTRIIEFDVKVN